MTSDGLAQFLRELRASKGASLRVAAEALDIDPSHLSRIERGEKQPSGELRDRVARYYEIDDESLSLVFGAVPDDVIEILRRHPELIEQLRAQYGD